MGYNYILKMTCSHPQINAPSLMIGRQDACYTLRVIFLSSLTHQKELEGDLF